MDQAELKKAEDFLRHHEALALSLLGRLQINGKFGRPRLGEGRLFAQEDEEGLCGLLLLGPSVLPILEPRLLRSGRLSEPKFLRTVRSYNPAQIVGGRETVWAIAENWGLRPKVEIAYRLMERPAEPRPLSFSQPRAVVVRSAREGDLKQLLQLQEAYEREEVLTPIHHFNQAACEMNLREALHDTSIWVVEKGEELVAKLGPCNRGFSLEQIGGVYTKPNHRNQGLAQLLLGHYLNESSRKGRGTSLYVKIENKVAQAIYTKLGFRDIGDYGTLYIHS